MIRLELRVFYLWGLYGVGGRKNPRKNPSLDFLIVMYNNIYIATHTPHTENGIIAGLYHKIGLLYIKGVWM